MDSAPAIHRPRRARRGHLAATSAALLLFGALAAAAHPAAAQTAETERWVEALRDPDRRLAAAFVPPASAVETPEGVAVLIQALDDDDPAVRRAAAAALGESTVTSGRIVPALLRLFEDENGLVRAHAAVAAAKVPGTSTALLRTLVSVGEAGSGEEAFDFSPACPLVDGPASYAAIALGLVGAGVAGELVSVNDDRRGLARFAIGQMGPVGALEVRRHLHNPDPGPRAVAAGVLADLGPQAADAARMASGLAESLARLLTDPEQEIRRAAGAAVVEAVPGVGPAEREPLAQLLMEALESPRAEDVRSDALRALGLVGRDAAPTVPTIIPYVDDPDFATARAAISALGRIGGEDPRAIEAMARVARNGPEQQRGEAARGLTRHGFPGLSALVRIAVDTGAGAPARTEALDALRETAADDPHAREWLARSSGRFEAALQDRSASVRGAAASLLAVLDGTSGADALGRALQDRNEESWRRAILAAEALGPQGQEMLLARASEENRRGLWARVVPGVDVRPEREARGQALTAIGRASVADERAISVLRDGLEDDDPGVRASAAQGLAGLGPAGRPFAFELLGRVRAADAEEQSAMLRALAALSPLQPDAVPLLVAWLTDPGEGRRDLAARLLGAMGPHAGEAAPALREVVRGSDRTLAFVAAEALVAVDPPAVDDLEARTALYDGAVLELVDEAKERLVRALDCPVPLIMAMAMEGPGISDLPDFPWPPPLPSWRDTVERELLGGDVETLGDVHERIATAVRAAGFSQVPLYSVPGGFAVVTQVERIQDDGTPVPHPDRWNPGKVAPRSFGEYLAQLFLAPPGQFRMITLAVTTDPNVVAEGELTEEAARRLAEGGGLVLPPGLAAQPFGEHYVVALVYHFERRPGDQASLRRPGPIPLEAHLQGAGILQGLQVGLREEDE